MPTIASYRDPQASIEDRVENLLALMNMDEKLAQLGCYWSTAFVSTGIFDPEAVAEKIPHGIGQVTRIGAATGLRPRESAEFMNALASTWNPELVKQVAEVIRAQMLAVGARHALAPVLDVARDPRWGRVEETYGEDPVLIGTIGTAYVQGLQSDDLAHGVAATGKHFLGYAMSEGGRNWAPVQLGPRELREVYAEPFAAVIRNAGLATMMNSYASVDGLPCTGSPAILTSLLRDELGFKGTVVADYASVDMLMNHHRVAATQGEAACLALQAGLDMELPTIDCYGAPLRAEIEAGRLPQEVIDTAVRRVLRLKFQLGLFERPYVDAEATGAVFQTPEQRSLARKVVTLLKNDGVLPLSPTVKRLAVIGPGADDKRLLQGDYHYPSHLELIYASPQNIEASGLVVPQASGSYAPGPYYTPHVTPLAGLRTALRQEVEIQYAQGCDVLGDDRSGFAAAVQAARNADVAVVVVAGKSGLLRPVTVGEANGATNLDLTGVQPELLEALTASGTPLVVVVLSGRLPISMPRVVGQVPNYGGTRAGGDRAMFFDGYIDAPTSPLFAFGHGLSYTTFAYGELSVQAKGITDPIEISLEVRNTGECEGDEVVQLYCRDLVASVARPNYILLGFARVSLVPGQARKVTFTVHPSRLAFYDPSMRFVTEPGAFCFSVGASSTDIRAQQTITLDGEVTVYQQSEIASTIVGIL